MFKKLIRESKELFKIFCIDTGLQHNGVVQVKMCEKTDSMEVWYRNWCHMGWEWISFPGEAFEDYDKWFEKTNWKENQYDGWYTKENNFNSKSNKKMRRDMTRWKKKRERMQERYR